MTANDEHPIVLQDLQRIASADLPWEQLARKTVLVTGGAGFLGAYLVRALLWANQLHSLELKLVCLTRKPASAHLRLGAWRTDPALDVRSHDISLPLPTGWPAADCIIHCASQASPKYYGVDPVGTLLANTVGTRHLLDFAVQQHAERFLFFSTGEVYGRPLDPAHAITEQDYGYLDPMQVRSCYAESKRMGETMCAAWAHQHGLHASVVRPFHTYGPGMALDDGRVFADFVADVVAQRDIVLKSDGLAQRPFCYVADASIGFLTVLLKGAPAQAYNVANPAAEVSMRELAHTLAGLMPERRVGVRLDAAHGQPATGAAYLQSPVQRACPSIDKVARLGWQPTVSIADGFRRTIESYL